MSKPLVWKHDSPSPRTPSYHYKRVCCDAPERSRAVLFSEAESQWSSLFLGICIGTLCVDDAPLVSANDYERKTRSARSFFYTQSASTILFFSHLRVLYLPVCLRMHGHSKSALRLKRVDLEPILVRPPSHALLCRLPSRFWLTLIKSLQMPSIRRPRKPGTSW